MDNERSAAQVDTSIDFSRDTPRYPKKDPDAHNPRLRQYHKFLWSQPLPGGARFDLDDTKPSRAYLYHRADAGQEFGPLRLDAPKKRLKAPAEVVADGHHVSPGRRRRAVPWKRVATVGPPLARRRSPVALFVSPSTCGVTGARPRISST